MVLGKIIRARTTRGQARHAMDRGRRGPLAALRLGFGAVLIGLLSLGGVIAPAHAAAGEVDLVKTLDSVQEGSNTTDVFQTGGLVRYTLKLSCLSMTTECVTGTITDVLDPNLEFVQVYRPQESDSFTSTAGYDAGSRTVTIVAGSEAKPFRGGDTAEFVVVARVKSFPANNLVPGDPTHGIIPNQASALPKDGETPRVSDIVEIRVPKPTPNWNVGKRTSTTTTGVGETVIYEVRLTVPDTALQGNVDLQSATVVDHYPAGATVVDADGGVVNTVDRTITWTVPALTVAQMAATCSPFLWDGLCISASWVKRPKLAFPTTHFANGDVVTNEVDASFTFVDGTTGTGEDEVDVRLVTGTVSAQFGKTGPSTASLGQLVSWNHFYYNNGTVAVPGVTIEDPAIPAGLTNLLVRVAISAGNSWTLEVKENDAWTSQSGVGSIGGGLPLPEGAQAFRFTANWTVPVGGSVQLLLDATLAAGEVGDVLRNCATATPGSSAPSCYNTTIAVPKVRMRTAKAHLTTDPAGVKPGEEFRFGVAAKFFDGAAVDSGWVADALPPQFEYVATECVTQVGDVNWAGTNTGKQASFQQAVANCDPATAIEPTIGTTDVPVAGSTLLTWNDVPIQQAATGSTNITWVVFTVRVKPGTAVGSYTNTSYVGTDNALVYECISGSGVLVDHSDAKACKAEDPIIVQEAAVIDLTKWDKGPLPNVAEATGEESASCPDWEGFTRYPCVAQTPANGQFEYRFRMQNVGNINITDHVMYDILPYVGDTGVSQVLSAQNRGTQWRPVLTGPVVVESAPAAASPLIEYSLSSDPCRPEVAQGGADANWQGGGCSNDWLTAAQVTDWSAVKSFRVKSFQNGATWLPTQQIVLRVSMQAPDTALESVREPLNLSIAWNSTAHRAFRQNADGSTVRLLAAEPRKVGIIVPFPGVSVGDYVWLDGDRDGFQGGALDTPLKDITVTLKKKDASGVYQVVGTTTTDADGYYYFQYLDPGKEYSVTFSDIPAGLVPTIANAGGNSSNSATEDLNDSDAIDGVIEFVSPSTGDNLAAPGQADNPGLDAGYITPVVPVSIGDYVWFDTNRDGQQTAGEPVVPNVTVNLYAAGGTTPIRTTTTGPDGYYSFTGLDSSTPYTVEFVKPDGTTFTLQNTGADATDSDADRTTGRVEVTTPATGSNSGAPNQADDPTIDAGLVKYNLVLRKALQPGGLVGHRPAAAAADAGLDERHRLRLRARHRDLHRIRSARRGRDRQPDHGRRDGQREHQRDHPQRRLRGARARRRRGDQPARRADQRDADDGDPDGQRRRGRALGHRARVHRRLRVVGREPRRSADHR